MLVTNHNVENPFDNVMDKYPHFQVFPIPLSIPLPSLHDFRHNLTPLHALWNRSRGRLGGYMFGFVPVQAIYKATLDACRWSLSSLDIQLSDQIRSRFSRVATLLVG